MIHTAGTPRPDRLTAAGVVTPAPRHKSLRLSLPRLGSLHPAFDFRLSLKGREIKH